jgi:methanethiol oxidase
LADGADKLVIVDLKPGSPTYGKVVNSLSVEGRNEAHHGGFTDDRHQLWLADLDTSRVFIFDVYTDPSKPRYVKTIDNFEKTTSGAIGPHGAYALPGRILIPCLSNAKDKTGRTALVEFANDGNYITTHWLPTKEEAGGAANAQVADGYGYDARVLPRKNALLTSSFTGWNNYITELSKVIADPEAMKHFGQTDKRPNPADPQGPFYHTLRVFLIDRAGQIRNIYSSGTLDPRLVPADLKTLLVEESRVSKQKS